MDRILAKFSQQRLFLVARLRTFSSGTTINSGSANISTSRKKILAKLQSLNSQGVESGAQNLIPLYSSSKNSIKPRNVLILSLAQLLIWLNLADIALRGIESSKDERVTISEASSDNIGTDNIQSVGAGTNMQENRFGSENEGLTLQSDSNWKDMLVGAGIMAFGVSLSTLILFYGTRCCKSVQIVNNGRSLLINRYNIRAFFDFLPFSGNKSIVTSEVINIEQAYSASKLYTGKGNNKMSDGLNNQYIVYRGTHAENQKKDKGTFGYVLDRRGQFYLDTNIIDTIFYRNFKK